MKLFLFFIFAGTKIFYDRSFLLQCRNSPLTKSPPPNMAKIPGITTPGKVDVPSKENGEVIQDENQKKRGNALISFLCHFPEI